MLFDQVGHGVRLPPVEKANQRGEKQAERHRVEHSARVYTTDSISRFPSPSACNETLQGVQAWQASVLARNRPWEFRRARLRKVPISPLLPERAPTAFFLADHPHAITKSRTECIGPIINPHLRPLLDPTATEWTRGNSDGCHKPLSVPRKPIWGREPRTGNETTRSRQPSRRAVQ